MDPLLHLVIALVMAMLLLAAAIHKLADFAGFRRILDDYEVLPERLVGACARGVVGLELILGVCWLVQFTPAAVIVVTVLLLACYTGAIALNLARGRVHISCGCGGNEGQPLSPWMLPRNLLLMVAALCAGLPVEPRDLALVDGLTAIASVIAFTFTYLAFSQLLANAAAIRVWRES